MTGVRILLILSALLLIVGGCGRDDSSVTGPASGSGWNQATNTGDPITILPPLSGLVVDENFDNDEGGFVSIGGMGTWQPLPEGNWAFHSERGDGHPLTALVRGISYNLSDVLTFRFEVTIESGFGGPDNPALNIGFSDGDFTTGDVDLGLAANSLAVSFTGAASRFGIGARDRFSTQISSVAPAGLIHNGGTYRVEGTYDPATGLFSCKLTSLPGNQVIFHETIDLSTGAGFQGFSGLTHFGILWPNFGGAVSAIDGTWDNVFVETRGAGPLQLNFDIKPGSCPNPFNPKSQGKLPVAILGTADFDVHGIDVSSLLLEGVAPIRSSIEDVSAPVVNGNECDCTENGPDGYDDLTLKFETQDIVAALGPVSAGDVKVLTITGALVDGTPFEASDCVVIVGGKKDGKSDDENEWIVFARENDVWRVRPDGSDIERVVDLPEGAQVMGITLSPDASRLAYLEYYSEFSTSNRLVLVGIDGSNSQTVVPTGGNGASGVCDFHPDGTHVLYYRDISPGGGQNYELYEVSLDGTSDVNLTNHTNNEGCGSYSPTGDQITFSSGAAFCSACGDIYTQNHDGTGRTEIFDRCGDSDNTAVWSPDGARILVSSRCPAEEEDLYLIDPDGSNPVQLTNTPGVRERHKAWSPDGNRIVFERSGNLYFIDRDGSDEVLFLDNATWPDWAEGLPRHRRGSVSEGRHSLSVRP